MSQAAARIATETAPIPVDEIVEIRRADLPLCCPRPRDALWSMHPRVYLPIEDEPDRESVCPYCGARYRLTD